MDYDFYSILEGCGLCSAAFWIIGFPMLWIAVKKGRREFRVKGYLKTPSGLEWLSFLLRKRYEVFEDSTARFFFDVTRLCMIGGIIVLSAAVALVGCTFLLRGVSQVP
jgi:hypothetical protein